MENDKLTADINDWLCKLPRKEFEYVLSVTEREAKRSERLHANIIASLTAENAKLKEAIGGHLRHINNLRAMVGRLKREIYGDGPDIGDNPCPY